ncbi:flavodoxin domain-containing protein [Clostridium saudiense]|nr:flavodoxin domain-containing protein [Clostridium saudiense]
MKKVSIIYWSIGGNVELLANCISEGIEGEVEINLKHVNDASEEDIITADAIAMGSPAMVEDGIEQLEMKPFIDKLSTIRFNNKPLVLFGSCGWRDEKFIYNWESTMKDYGFDVIGKVVCKESLTEEEVKKAKSLGKELVNLM